MVQVIENTGGFGTRFGAALGKGLGEAIPKYVERQQLSKGLQSLNNVSMDKPLDAVSQMMNIPGMTLEKAQVLFPFLQQQMLRQEAMRRGGAQGQGGQGQSQSALQPNDIYNQATQGLQGNAPQGQIPNIANMPQLSREGEPLPPQGLISPEEQELTTKEFSPLAYQDKLKMASQLISQYPARFPTEQSAMEEIDRMESNREALFNKPKQEALNKKNLQTEAENEFNKQVSEKTQEDLGANPVWGDLMGDLRAKMLQEVRNGETVKDAAGKYGKIANEIAQTVTKLEERGGQSLWKASPADNRDLFKELGKKFDKLNKPKEYAQILAGTQNIPLPYAHPFAYPLDKNKDLAEYIKGVKGVDAYMKHHVGDKGYLEIADNIMKKLKPTDSPLTAVLALKNKGLDASRMLNILKTQYEDKFTKEQWDALSGVTQIEPNLSSNWLYSFSGMP